MSSSGVRELEQLELLALAEHPPHFCPGLPSDRHLQLAVPILVKDQNHRAAEYLTFSLLQTRRASTGRHVVACAQRSD